MKRRREHARRGPVAFDRRRGARALAGHAAPATCAPVPCAPLHRLDRHAVAHAQAPADAVEQLAVPALGHHHVIAVKPAPRHRAARCTGVAAAVGDAPLALGKGS
eukprot:2670257-Prymnesium_polylepis.1